MSIACLNAARHLGCLTGEGWNESRKGRGGRGRKGRVPFDLLQPSVCFPIKDGGCNLRTKDYSVLSLHKICLQARYVGPNLDEFHMFVCELTCKDGQLTKDS